MNTSSSLKPFASPPLISTVKSFTNSKFSPKLPKFSPEPIRCMRDSNSNHNFGSKPKPNLNPPSHEFSVSFATVSIEAPLGTTTSDKLRLLVSEFRSLTEPIDRVKRLLNYASTLAPLDESARVPANRVNGCTTQVWLEIKKDELGRMRFRADSDSEISKGFCSCLIWILDGAKPEEVMGVRSEDLAEMNVGVHGKAQSRVNTWHNVLMSMQKRTMALVDDADVAHREGDMPPPPHQHQHDLLFEYVNGSYMESSSKVSDYSISLLPLYYDFTI
uniref:SufE-like protein 2, chloroplastic n=1 Tax=Noccaea caerulescens TaxID=107243 RepID=A0A1J3CGW3_NOCCA